jgi:hypothetical protein
MKTNRLLIAISFLLLAGCAIAPLYDSGCNIPYITGHNTPYDAGYDPPYDSGIVPHKVGETGGFY